MNRLAELVDARHRKRRIAKDLAELIDHYSAFAALALMLTIVELPDDESFVACTDGREIRFGKPFFAMRQPERKAVIMHEIGHAALSHPLRAERLRATDPAFDLDVWNIACDITVNEIIAGERDLVLPKGALSRSNIEGVIGKGIDNGLTSEQIYWLLKRSGTTIPAPGMFGDIIPAAASPGRPADGDGREGESPDGPEPETQKLARWNAHAKNAIGSLPARMRRVIHDIPGTNAVPWKNVLRNFLGRNLAPTARTIDYSRPHQRWSAIEPRVRAHGCFLPVIPSMPRPPAPRLAVGVDTSGSTYDMIGQFTREIAAMLTRTNAEVLLIVCDAKVHLVEELSGAAAAARLRTIEYPGGGGTNFAPAIARAAAWKPTAMVYLTDLFGPAGPAPTFPVLWTVPESSGNITPPFGRLLRLPG